MKRFPINIEEGMLLGKIIVHTVSGRPYLDVPKSIKSMESLLKKGLIEKAPNDIGLCLLLPTETGVQLFKDMS